MNHPQSPPPDPKASPKNSKSAKNSDSGNGSKKIPYGPNG